MTLPASSYGSVAVAVLTNRWSGDVDRLLAALSRQSVASHTYLVCAQTAPPGALSASVTYVPSTINLGGAGGFAYAVLSAIASGADWIWMMDDDACPSDELCLETLLREAGERKLDVVSPVIVAPDDPQRLSFPLQISGKLEYDLDVVRSIGFIPNVGQFFNGALIRREVFFKIGLPDMRLFIRGDEVDFMLKLRAAKLPFGTTAEAIVRHPPGWGEVVDIVPGRVAVLVPQTDFKRYYFFRNRGYLARRHRRLKSLLLDLICYPIALLIKKRDPATFRLWWQAYSDGLRYKFDATPR